MEPKYQINLGYIARTLLNFGIKDLFLINPRCNHLGKQALKYSKHARQVLEGARICGSVEEAASGRSIIGTTGIWHKTNASFYNVYALNRFGDAARRMARTEGILLLIGRDDIGLTKEELRRCDATVYIAADKDYPVLNISHALAVMLYEITRDGKHEQDFASVGYADRRYQRRLSTLFRRLVEASRHVRDRESVSMAFEHVLARSVPTKKEVNAIAAALSDYGRGRKEKPGRGS